MKKALVVLMMLLASFNANAVRVYPAGKIDYNNGYNRGYDVGYKNGKSDGKQKVARDLVVTGMVIVGVAVVYNIITSRPVNQPVRTSVRF